MRSRVSFYFKKLSRLLQYRSALTESSRAMLRIRALWTQHEVEVALQLAAVPGVMVGTSEKRTVGWWKQRTTRRLLPWLLKFRGWRRFVRLRWLFFLLHSSYLAIAFYNAVALSLPQSGHLLLCISTSCQLTSTLKSRTKIDCWMKWAGKWDRRQACFRTLSGSSTWCSRQVRTISCTPSSSWFYAPLLPSKCSFLSFF